MCKFLGKYRKLLLLSVCLILGFIIITLTIKTSSSLENPISTLKTSLPSNSCKPISVEELDQWFHSKQWNEIPKLIHQTWKTNNLRERQARWSQTWCEQYTDWYYRLWTDDENDLFVQTRFPWFYPTYRKLSPAILKVDSVRYLYMLYYGGLYVRYLVFKKKYIRRLIIWFYRLIWIMSQ